MEYVYCMWAVSSVCFFLEIRRVFVEYVEKDLSDFKVIMWSPYASDTEGTVLDEYVSNRLTLKQDTSYSTY